MLVAEMLGMEGLPSRGCGTPPPLPPRTRRESRGEERARLVLAATTRVPVERGTFSSRQGRAGARASMNPHL